MNIESNKVELNKYYRRRILILIAILAISIIIALVYRNMKLGLFSYSDYKAINKSLTEECQSFSSNEDMASFITGWADDNGIDYEIDEADNIIFTSKSSMTKATVEPVAIVVSYNYKTALLNADALTSALYIAGSGINSTRYNVIFVNNDNGEQLGYQKLDSSIFDDDSKVIYLDYGKSTYASRDSFNQRRASYIINKEMQPTTCDTVVHLHISGITTDEITSRISKQVNPITAFGTVLAKLEGKASHYELANIKVGNQGNMFPTSIDADFIVNSYSVQSLCEYIDDRIESINDKYKDEFPELDYSYEVIDNESRIPAECYSESVCKSLNNIIYTFDNGTYRFDEDDDIPADYEKDEIYGVNSIEQLTETDDAIVIDICTQALSNAYLKSITSENKTIASFSSCSFKSNGTVEAFHSNAESLYNQLNFTYIKVNDVSSKSFIIKEKEDHYFTPCSYLQSKNNKMDIIHLTVNEDSGRYITNTLICFIDSLGNFLTF